MKKGDEQTDGESMARISASRFARHFARWLCSCAAFASSVLENREARDVVGM